MKTLGELLKEERGNRGLSIEKTAGILKVRKKYLENIESDNYKELPPDVYIKGFLRNYARLLGLKEEKIVEVFDHQKKVKQKNRDNGRQKNLISNRYKKNRLSKISITPEIFIIGTLVVIGVLVIFYFFKSAKNFSQTPLLEIENPKENETVDDENITVIGEVSGGSKLEINNQEVKINENGFFETQITLMDGVNEILVRAENKFGRVNEKRLFIHYDNKSSQEKKAKIVVLKVDSEPIWVSIKNESVDFSGTLAANSSKSVEINEPTIIIVEKGNGIYYIENGRKMVIFGESGEKTEKIFQP